MDPDRDHGLDDTFSIKELLANSDTAALNFMVMESQ
jgi:hypothetical protein